MLDRCAFASFNYDILIDNALERQNPDFAVDYGIEFVNPSTSDEAVEQPIRIPLLKLHGSLNWLYCATCRTIVITKYQKGVSDLIVAPSQCHCDKCFSLAVPIIIPPTYFKVLSNIFLQNVWYRAEQILGNCRTWVFCGYSFPDADMHVKYLLKRVQVNAANPRKIFVLNCHDGKDPRQAADEEKRYRRFFGTFPEIEYADYGFEKFAADPNETLRAK